MSEFSANWDFPADLSAPDQARHHTADALMAWGVDHLVDDAVLIVSELITNAVRHAQSPTRLDLRCVDATLWIGVHDDSLDEPTVREWRHDDSGGLGLLVVGAVSRWHIESDSSGKTVWCTLGEEPSDDAVARFSTRA